MEINERIRYLRKNELHMTQDAFASKIDLSRSNLGNIEIGRIAVTERVISSICRVFNVSEDWLKTGNGDPFIPMSREEQIEDFMGDVLREEPTFKRRLISALAKLSDEDWIMLEKKLTEIVNGNEEEN